MLGIDRIVDFIIEKVEEAIPCFTVNAWERAAVLRNGVVHRIRGPGLHWKISFFENPNIISVVTTTMDTPIQTLTTSDKKAVSISAVVKYNIFDVEKYTTEIYDAIDALSDITQGHIMTESHVMTYDECRDTGTFSNTLTKKVRNDVKKYGIGIEQITIANFIETRNYRLLNEN